MEPSLSAIFDTVIYTLNAAEAELLRQFLNSVDQSVILNTTYLDDVERFHTFHMLFLGVDEVLTEPTSVANPFGGAPVSGVVDMRVLDVVDGDGCGSVEIAFRPDEEGLASMLQDFVEGATESGVEMPADKMQELKAVMGEVSAVSTFVGQVDLTTGHLWRMTSIDLTAAGSGSRTDTIVLADVTPKAGG